MSLPNGVTLRTYRGGDEHVILSVWNRALPKDNINLTVLTRQVLCDANFDPQGLWLAETSEGIVGFCLALRRLMPLSGTSLEPENGWISAFGVDPAWQRRGIGAALFDKAEEFLAQDSRENCFVSSYAPNYFWPGVDENAYPAAIEFLKRRGYETLYTPVAMDKNLVHFEYPEDVRDVEKSRTDEGYRFETLSSKYIYELIAYARDTFNPDWGRAIREAIAAGLPWDQIFLAISPQDRVVGFALYGGYGAVQERFGPFGVDESERGKGLGKVLLYKCLLAMQSRGLHGAWFLWTGETQPAGHLYLRAGFEITRKFHVMKKALR